MIVNQLSQEQIKTIINLYNETHNIHEVARVIGRSRVTIQKYLRENGVVQDPVQCAPTPHSESKRRERVRKSDGIVRTCEYCGKQFVRNGNRIGNEGTRFCSRDCWYAKCREDKAKTRETKEALRIKTCVICGKEFRAVHGRLVYCSDECERKKNREYARENYDSEKQKQYYLTRRQEIGLAEHHSTCLECGKEFTFWAKPENFEMQKFCSAKCREKASSRTNNHVRRVRIRTAKHDNITILQLMKRDHNTCQICGCKVHKQSGPFKKGKYDPTIATIDHIIPLSNGGTHTWDNVQLACTDCNASKSDNMYGVQLNLFIGGAYL